SGMSSRLAYSVAFKAVREMLVIDEIFAVGDAGFRAKCLARYRELSKAGHTVLLVSHEPSIVSENCRRAILLEGGTIVKEGSGAEISQAYLEVASRPLVEPQRVAYERSALTAEACCRCLDEAFQILGQPKSLLDLGCGSGFLVG